MKSTTDTRAGLESRMKELSHLREELSQRHGQTALRAAEGDMDAIAELGNIVAAIGQAKTEQDAIRAALSALQRRERAEVFDESVREFEEQGADAIAAVQEAHNAFVKVGGVLSEFGSAYRAMKTAEVRANLLEADVALLPHGHREYAGGFNFTGLVAALVWLEIGELHATRSDTVIDSCGRKFPDAPAQGVGQQRDRAINEINRGIAHRITELQSRANAIRQPATLGETA